MLEIIQYIKSYADIDNIIKKMLKLFTLSKPTFWGWAVRMITSPQRHCAGSLPGTITNYIDNFVSNFVIIYLIQADVLGLGSAHDHFAAGALRRIIAGHNY
jgi:hypothetical protein